MNERDDNGRDRLVSDAYRELAKERTPKALDDKVLRMAARAKPARSVIPGRWMKPVAWAATIGLSLAIVMELTQVPQTPPDSDGVGPALPSEAPAMRAASPETGTDERRDRPLQMEKSAASEPPPITDSQDRIRDRRDVKPARHRAELPVVEEAAVQGMTSAPERLESSSTVNVDAEADGAVSLADKPAAAAMAGPMQRMVMAEPALCPADARETAEDWYRCIEKQRAVSPAEAIDNEIKALREQFPDFPIPGMDK